MQHDAVGDPVHDLIALRSRTGMERTASRMLREEVAHNNAVLPATATDHGTYSNISLP